ncbi:collagen-like protein, partial [bacterium]|nr:collagen-like protein [bacterium]
AQGVQGSVGAQGVQGSVGAQGVQGSVGAQGVQGVQGATGPSTAINATDDNSTSALYPVMVGATGSNQTPKTSTSKLYFNASTGTIYATAKSFKINHPTKPNMSLIYGSLEGPENGVYIRGRIMNKNFIELPEYWVKLVEESTITVQLTPIGMFQKLVVDKIENNMIWISNKDLLSSKVYCYFIIFGERKDISKLEVEV